MVWCAFHHVRWLPDESEKCPVCSLNAHVAELEEACVGFERSAVQWRSTALFAQVMAKRAQARAHALESVFCCDGPLTKHENGAVTNTVSIDKLGAVYDRLAELEAERDRLLVEVEAWRKDDDLAADREWVTP